MAGALAAPSLHASIVVLTELPGEANNGGPFHAVTTDNGAFNTFCISIATTFSPGTPYYYDVSSTITANGVPPAPDYIALGTAYIYNQYLQNNANYVNNASAVQSAIWYFQGLLTQNAGVNSGDPTDPENNVDLQSDISKIEGFMTAAGAGADISGANGKGAFGIEAMNLYTVRISRVMPNRN